jgi:type IV secretion system protein VirB9
MILSSVMFVAGVGCAQQTPHLPDPEPLPLAEAVPACQDKPPVYIEVPTPVPMPCQLKAVSAPRDATPRRTKTSGAQRVRGANQQARHEPADEQWINSVQQYPYMPGALFQVYAAPIQVTTILFQAGEQLVSFMAGDTERWLVEASSTGAGESRQDVLVLKPKFPDIQTNLTVTTNKRVYLLELRSTKRTYMAAVSWSYPQEASLTVVRHQQAEAHAPTPIAAGVTPDRLNFDYDIRTGSKSPRWRPIRVFDDREKTYIQFPQDLHTTEAPALFLKSAEGTVSLVNYRKKGDFYIVDRLIEYAELRVGEKKPVVVTITRAQAF